MGYAALSPGATTKVDLWVNQLWIPGGTNLQCTSHTMRRLSKLLLLIQERPNCGASVPSDRLKASIFPPLECGRVKPMWWNSVRHWQRDGFGGVRVKGRNARENLKQIVIIPWKTTTFFLFGNDYKFRSPKIYHQVTITKFIKEGAIQCKLCTIEALLLRSVQAAFAPCLFFFFSDSDQSFLFLMFCWPPILEYL